MTDIDETTGLPTLPEGHFWEVQKSGDKVSLDINVRYYELVQKKKKFLWFYIHYGEKTERVPRITTIIWDHIQTKRDGVTAFDPSQKINRMADIRPGELTAEILFEAAVNLKKEWELRDAASSLFGQYPPNKLEGVNLGSQEGSS